MSTTIKLNSADLSVERLIILLLLNAGIGLGMWMLGAVFTGVSQNFGFLLFARIFMGAGRNQPAFCMTHFLP